MGSSRILLGTLILVFVAILLVGTLLTFTIFSRGTQVITGRAVVSKVATDNQASVPVEPIDTLADTGADIPAADTGSVILNTPTSAQSSTTSGASTSTSQTTFGGGGSRGGSSGSGGSSASGSTSGSGSTNNNVVVVYADTQKYLQEKFGDEANILSTIDPNTPVDVGGVTVPAGDVASTLAELMQDLEK